MSRRKLPIRKELNWDAVPKDLWPHYGGFRYGIHCALRRLPLQKLPKYLFPHVNCMFPPLMLFGFCVSETEIVNIAKDNGLVRWTGAIRNDARGRVDWTKYNLELDVTLTGNKVLSFLRNKLEIKSCVLRFGSIRALDGEWNFVYLTTNWSDCIPSDEDIEKIQKVFPQARRCLWYCSAVKFYWGAKPTEQYL